MKQVTVGNCQGFEQGYGIGEGGRREREIGDRREGEGREGDET